MYVSFVADEQVLDVAGQSVAITSPGKAFFSERGETKLDLVRYYLAVEGPLMHAVRGRPTLMQRFPHGAEGRSFSPTWRTWSGRSTSPASAFTSGPTSPIVPTSQTSCGSTSTRSRALGS